MSVSSARSASRPYPPLGHEPVYLIGHPFIFNLSINSIYDRCYSIFKGTAIRSQYLPTAPSEIKKTFTLTNQPYCRLHQCEGDACYIQRPAVVELLLPLQHIGVLVPYFTSSHKLFRDGPS